MLIINFGCIGEVVEDMELLNVVLLFEKDLKKCKFFLHIYHHIFQSIMIYWKPSIRYVSFFHDFNRQEYKNLFNFINLNVYRD